MQNALEIHYQFFETLDSTNEEAKRQFLAARGNVAQPQLIVARHQTAGRGTQGRAWASPLDAGLYCSLLYTPQTLSFLQTLPLNPESIARLTHGAAQVCCDWLVASFDIPVYIKPVNDIYLDVEGVPHKLAGILTESWLGAEGTLSGLVTGIGLNIRAVVREVSQAKAPAIALEDVLSREQLSKIDWESWTKQLARNLTAYYCTL